MVQCHLAPIWNKKQELAFVVNTFVDLTDLKEYEVELQTSRNKYKTLIQNIPDVIWTSARNGTITFISNNVQKIDGYSSEDIYKQSKEFWIDRIHKEDINGVVQAFEALFETGAKFDVDYRMQKKNGEWIWLNNRSMASYEKNGTFYADGILKDITKRKEIEQELKENQEKFQLAMEATNDAMWDWNMETNETYRNPQNAIMLGYQPEELSSKQGAWFERIHPDDKKRISELIEDHKSGIKNHFNCEYRLETKSGKYIWILGRGKVIEHNFNGSPSRMLGTNIDITKRKESEKQLKESEAFFRMISEQAPVMMDAFDKNGRCILWNRECEKVFGWTEEEILTHENPLELFYPDPEIRNQVIETVISTPDNDFREWHSVRKDGEELTCLWANFKLPDGRIISLGRDITESHKIEEMANIQRESLARIGRASSMGQLTGSIAHELNQPLTGILSNAQAAELIINTGKWNNELLMEILSDIVNDTKRAGEVIRNLRELYRGQKVEFYPFDINSTINDTVQLIHSELVKEHVVLNVKPNSSVPTLKGNQVQIQQVLVNLILNGIQAMENKNRDDRKLEVHTTHNDNELKILVIDSGTGIDPDKIDHIFEPLATWKPGGTGMGLAISNSIVESHGGRMWAENRPEGGTLVGFALPLIN